MTKSTGSASMPREPGSDGPADFRPGILLDEMAARHGHFRLIAPAAAELALVSDQNGAGIGIDKQFGDVVLAHPSGVGGNRLGDDRNSRYEAKTTELVPGDVLIWYTDGIVECENEAGEEYGEKRFRASVRKAAALDAGEMRDAIITEAGAYFGEAVRKDDITMVVGRIH